MIAADPQQLFDIVADPAMHPVIDGSGTRAGGARRRTRRGWRSARSSAWT